MNAGDRCCEHTKAQHSSGGFRPCRVEGCACVSWWKAPKLTNDAGKVRRRRAPSKASTAKMAADAKRKARGEQGDLFG